MSKMALRVPAVALAILLVTMLFPPVASAQVTRALTPSMVAEPTVLVAQADPSAVIDDFVQAFIDLVNTAAGIAAALAAGASSGLNSFVANSTSDDSVATSASSAQQSTQAAVATSADAAVGSVQEFGADVSFLLSDGADLLTGALSSP